jgi:glycosyltransferase involved in cell wall biosynthesis
LREQLKGNQEEAAVLNKWYVLFLANGFTTTPEPSGGSKHFIELARNWRQMGQQLVVMTPEIGKENCELEGFSGPFITVPPKWADRLGIMTMYLVRGLTALFKLPWSRSPLLLYGTSDMLPDVLPAFAARLLRPRSVFWANCIFHLIPNLGERAGSRLDNTASFLAQRLSHKLIRASADLVIVDNPILRDDLVAMGFNRSRIFVTMMGVDIPQTETEGTPVYDACFLGRLHPSKGISDLVKIWRRVCDSRPGSRLAVIGTGPLEETLKTDIREMSMEGLAEIMGYLPRDELNQVMSSSSVFVFPSHEEGFGIGLLEGMAFGLPAVAYALPHYNEVFEDVPVLVPVGDIDGFAAKVLEMLKNKELREIKSAESRELASHYTWENVTSREVCAIVRAVRFCGNRFKT